MKLTTQGQEELSRATRSFNFKDIIISLMNIAPLDDTEFIFVMHTIFKERMSYYEDTSIERISSLPKEKKG